MTDRTVLLLCGVFSFSSCWAQSCTLKKEKDGIAVYTCNEKDSKLKSIRVELVLENQTPAQLATLLDDIADYANWQYKMIESKVLQRVNDHEVIYRTVMEAPWPADNREMIAKKTVAYDSTTKTLSIVVKSVSYPYAEDDDLVRVPFSEATWKVVVVKKDLHVTYWLRVDPGGSIPAWIINMGIADGPFHSFGHLKARLNGQKK